MLKQSFKNLRISLKMSIFVYELRQGLDSPTDYGPADLAATKTNVIWVK